ncbi:hypothetical protein [Brumimicrobium aurantiacum]|uniref:Uncharacterized protein n=1 Tax=Brumimicrobium aurantiacum TaxID=1737063 RepID=A0A3E1EZ75_9FLAO|nr:hypothetical protein [Brumimicrobium aurantiacum]RFC54869.1 hypothetical protein DXU93_03345 [Brumimicrobium aurantiacum]
MVTTKAPIGEVINFLYKNDGLYKDEPLLRKIRNLVDLIILRTEKDGVEKTLGSLEDDLFKLRLDIINESQLLQDITKNINDTIQDRVIGQFDKTTNQKKLELAFVKSLKIYGEITENILDKIPNNSFSSIKNFPQLNYKSFIDLLQSLPGKESQFIISYLKSSITLDFALIVAELIFDNKLKLKKSEVENLVLTLKNSIEEYAVFSNKFGLWNPSDDDESQWIRNIKIRISLFESKNNSDNLSSDEISKILVA